jgi:hypothetical protein
VHKHGTFGELCILVSRKIAHFLFEQIKSFTPFQKFALEVRAGIYNDTVVKNIANSTIIHLGVKVKFDDKKKNLQYIVRK